MEITLKPAIRAKLDACPPLGWYRVMAGVTAVRGSPHSLASLWTRPKGDRVAKPDWLSRQNCYRAGWSLSVLGLVTVVSASAIPDDARELGGLDLRAVGAGILLAGLLLLAATALTHAVGALKARFAKREPQQPSETILPDSEEDDHPVRPRSARLNDIETRRLHYQYGNASQVLSSIRNSARETIQDLEKLKSVPYTQQAPIKEAIERRRRRLRQEAHDWDVLTARLVERVYGEQGRSYYQDRDDDGSLPPHDPPGFDTAAAEVESTLFTDVWRQAWRLHALLENDGDIAPNQDMGGLDVTLSEHVIWDSETQKGSLLIRVTNHGPKGDFVATVEDVTGAGRLEIPWPVRWRNADGRTCSIAQGGNEMLYLADVTYSPNFLIARELHFQRPTAEPVKATFRVNPTPTDGEQSPRANIRLRITANGLVRGWPIHVWFQFGYLKDRGNVGIWRPRLLIVGSGR